MTLTDSEFEVALDQHQARLRADAAEAEERSWDVAARPNAERVEVTFADLRVGDWMTSDGVRWVRVVKLYGSHCYVRSRQEAAPDGYLSVLFEIAESVHHSGETRYWIDRPPGALVVVDGAARMLTTTVVE